MGGRGSKESWISDEREAFLVSLVFLACVDGKKDISTYFIVLFPFLLSAGRKRNSMYHIHLFTEHVLARTNRLLLMM